MQALTLGSDKETATLEMAETHRERKREGISMRARVTARTVLVWNLPHI